MTGVSCNKVEGIGEMKCNEYIYTHGSEGRPGTCTCTDTLTDRILQVSGVNKQQCIEGVHTVPLEEGLTNRLYPCNWTDAQYPTAGYSARTPISPQENGGGDGCSNLGHIGTGARVEGRGIDATTEMLREQAKSLNVMGLTSVSQLIGRVIKILFAFIGSIAFVLYILSGFMWMTASGNSERVTKAKSILVWTSLGVVVMLASYLLVDFVFQNLK